MIEYQEVTNELVLNTKELPQNCGKILEQISIDNYNSDCRYFLELKCPKDKRYITEQISFIDNVGSVNIPNIISRYVGKVFVQLVIRNSKGEIINKSLISKAPMYVVVPSINAVIDISKEKTEDCLSYIIGVTDKALDDLQQKVDNGYFNGKDGTCIKVSGSKVEELSFNSNPQEQIDCKVDITDANKVIMCPSTNQIKNIFPSISTWKDVFYDYVAPSNGYIIVYFSTVDNQQIQNGLCSSVNNVTFVDVSASPTNVGNVYSLSIPVVKDSVNRLVLFNKEKILENSFDSVFIYSEVL